MPIGLITARGGSKRVPGKNTRIMAGKPMIAWTIEAARASRCLTRVVVSTDDEQIASVAEQFGAETPFLRPPSLATDTSTSLDVLLHCAQELNLPRGERFVLLQPTSPLRTATDIDDACALALETGSAVVSVTPAPHGLKWLYSLDGNGRVSPAPFSFGSDMYMLNGAIYICSVATLLDERTLIPGGSTAAYVMPPERSIDVDEEWEFRLAAHMLEVRR